MPFSDTSSHRSGRRAFLTVSGLALSATAFALAGCSTRSALTPTPGAADESAAALPMVNTLRQSHGLSTLSLDNKPTIAAEQQAVRMAKAEEMSHLIGLGDSFFNRMKSADVPLPAAENIASGQQTVDRAVQAWIDSPKHLENMLGNYKSVGVAVARGQNGRTYWSMVLSS
jgi:uncharacterized protein YkwD